MKWNGMESMKWNEMEWNVNSIMLIFIKLIKDKHLYIIKTVIPALIKRNVQYRKHCKSGGI